MKIFYLTTKSEFGGVQTHIFQLANYFIEKKEIIAVMSYPGGWLERKTIEIGAKFYPNNFLLNNPNPFFALKAMEEIKKAVSEFKPDLISCHSTLAGFLGRLTIKNKIPTIFTVHGWGFTPGTSIWRRIVLPVLERIASRYCQKIICVSEYDRNLALRYKIAPPEKLITIHNGIEIDKKFFSSQIYSIGSKIKIVFVGRLCRQKDPLLLISVFNELDPKLKENLEILIIGDGEKKKKLEKFIQKNKIEKKVKLLGFLPREQVLEVLKTSHIFVLTSNWEGFPISILEAMSFGLAVIASDVGGIKEIIEENCGILVKRGSKEELRIAIEKLILNPDLIFEYGKKAKEKVEQFFSLDKMLTKTANIYSEVLK